MTVETCSFENGNQAGNMRVVWKEISQRKYRTPIDPSIASLHIKIKITLRFFLFILNPWWELWLCGHSWPEPWNCCCEFGVGMQLSEIGKTGHWLDWAIIIVEQPELFWAIQFTIYNHNHTQVVAVILTSVGMYVVIYKLWCLLYTDTKLYPSI